MTTSEKVIEELGLREHGPSDPGIRSNDDVVDYVNDENTVVVTSDPDGLYSVEVEQWDTEVESLADDNEGYLSFRANGREHHIDQEFIPDCINPLDAKMDTSRYDFPVMWELEDGNYFIVAPLINPGDD